MSRQSPTTFRAGMGLTGHLRIIWARRVTSLEVEVARAVTSSVLALGFATADLAVRRPSGGWFVAGAQSKRGETLPTPEHPAGAAVTAAQFECLDLLAAQAGVAMGNG